MRALARGSEWGRYYVAAGVFFGASLGLNLLCAGGLLLPGKERLDRPLRSLLQKLFAFWWRMLSGLGILKLERDSRLRKDGGGGRIWIMNHPSIIDTAYLLAFLPRGVCIYKQSIASNPFYGCIAKLANYIPNVGGPDMIRMAVDALERGEDVVVFPEGTRSSRFDAGNLKPGFALIAQRSRAPMHALWLDGPQDFLRRESNGWIPPRMPMKAALTELAVLQAGPGDRPEQIIRRVAEIYRRRGPAGRGCVLLPDAHRNEAKEGVVEISFQVPLDYRYVEGHFPGNPIVPGVTQIGWILEAVSRLERIDRYRLSRYRFARVIKPGDAVRARVEARDGGFKCQVFANGELASRGTLKLQGGRRVRRGLAEKGPFRALVLMPSFNTGPDLLERTVGEALASCRVPVWTIIDGSTDGSGERLQVGRHGADERLRVMIKDENEGKGAAVTLGLLRANEEGFTHALVMDADGQHPADRIEDFLTIAARRPEAMVLGQPLFDASVPAERLHGRKLSVGLVQLETRSEAIGDPLFGFRVYPIEPLLKAMKWGRRSRRYDFDPEVAVRLHWAGVPALKVPAKVSYLSREQGGVSHFRYLRDNLRFVWLHTRLLVEAPFRWEAQGANGNQRGERL